jgi:hypothetical protein
MDCQGEPAIISYSMVYYIVHDVFQRLVIDIVNGELSTDLLKQFVNH